MFELRQELCLCTIHMKLWSIESNENSSNIGNYAQIESANAELYFRVLSISPNSEFSDRKRRIITHFTHVRVQRSSSIAAAVVDDEAAMEIHYIALLSFDTNRATAFPL